MSTHPIHFDCVACLAKGESGEHATLALMSLLHAESDYDQVLRDLCFFHRRRVESTAKEMASRPTGDAR